MARIDVQTSGFPQALRRLDRLGDQAFNQRPTMEAQARDASRRVVVTARDTGRLAASIEPLDVDPFGFVLGTKVPYAHFVFDGTKNMRAQPPRVPRGIGDQTARAIGRSVTS
jgi:hypothetical protein